MKKIILLIGLLIPALIRAQTYSIPWYKIAGGGGASAGGQFSITGTAGQHDAGNAISGGSYSLSGGYWSIISVLPAPGAPPLYIHRSGAAVTISWQRSPAWALEQNTNPAVTNGWTASSGIVTADGTNSLTISSPRGNLFFRLANPQ